MNLTADDVDWTYGFNKVNQLLSKTLSGGANLALYKWEPSFSKNDAYTANGLNQYATVAGATIVHDKAGNLTSDGVWSYVYDVENMLLNASKPGRSASYIYDPLGRRSAKTVDTVLTTFLHDGVEEIGDYDSSGTLLRRYVHGPGVDEYLVMYTGTGTTNKSYFHANHQGSIIAMTDASGNVTEQHNYDSYGNSDDLTGNPFRYTGRRLDEETGLYYYRARYYSPAIGRFLQTDPIGYGDGLNWYAYVQNNPLNRTDPTGEIKIELGAELVLVAGGGGKIAATASFDTETFEVGGSFTAGLRVGLEAGGALIGSISKSGTEATNSIEAKAAVNVEGSVGPISASVEIASASTKDGLKGPGGDTKLGASVKPEGKISAKFGASAGVDFSVNATTTVVNDAANSIADVAKEAVNELFKLKEPEGIDR